MLKKNKNKGFTLIEIVVAVAIVALLSGFVIISSFVVPQVKMKHTAQTFKTKFELAKEYAESHGGIAQFSIKKTVNGAEITTVGVEGQKEVDLDRNSDKTLIDDAALEIRYFRTGTAGSPLTLEYDESLTFQFSQTEGSIIGPDLIDYIILGNKSKEYKFWIEHKTGTLYYDYELANNYEVKNKPNPTTPKNDVPTPTFIKDGQAVLGKTTSVSRENNSGTIQPEINYDSRYVKIGGEYRVAEEDIEIGRKYVITFTLKDPYEKGWESNSPGWSPTEEEPFEIKKLEWYIN